MEVNKPTFVLCQSSFLGIPTDESNDIRIKKHLKEDRKCPKVRSFYVHGELEARLKYDICKFTSGIINFDPEQDSQDAIIFDLNDEPHESKIILIQYNKSLWGYLVDTNEDSQKIKNEMIEKLEKYDCI